MLGWYREIVLGADLKEIVSFAVVGKQTERVRAEERKAEARPEVVPELLEPNRGGRLAIGAEERDHFAKGGNIAVGAARRRLRYATTYDLVKARLVRPSVNHELGEGFGGVQRDEAAVKIGFVMYPAIRSPVSGTYVPRDRERRAIGAKIHRI